MLKDWWAHLRLSQVARTKDLQAALARTERKIEQLMDRTVDVGFDALVDAYEKRINALERERVSYQETINNGAKPVRSFDESLRTALRFLAKPHELWASEASPECRADQPQPTSERP